ncbi:MAG: hypothetical protein MK110_04530 [Fuerstiella sp.]|nr:hypothetical protein [Fuerstiella sp.]
MSIDVSTTSVLVGGLENLIQIRVNQPDGMVANKDFGCGSVVAARAGRYSPKEPGRKIGNQRPYSGKMSQADGTSFFPYCRWQEPVNHWQPSVAFELYIGQTRNSGQNSADED